LSTTEDLPPVYHRHKTGLLIGQSHGWQSHGNFPLLSTTPTVDRQESQTTGLNLYFGRGVKTTGAESGLHLHEVRQQAAVAAELPASRGNPSPLRPDAQIVVGSAKQPISRYCSLAPPANDRARLARHACRPTTAAPAPHRGRVVTGTRALKEISPEPDWDVVGYLGEKMWYNGLARIRKGPRQLRRGATIRLRLARAAAAFGSAPRTARLPGLHTAVCPIFGPLNLSCPEGKSLKNPLPGSDRPAAQAAARCRTLVSWSPKSAAKDPSHLPTSGQQRAPRPLLEMGPVKSCWGCSQGSLDWRCTDFPTTDVARGF
jgi:hypothetical protein